MVVYDAPMATSNPRLTITLEPSTAAQLRRMSELTGNSQSQMVSEILAQSSEVFERMIRVLEAAEVARGLALVDVADQAGAGSSASWVQRGHATAAGGMMRSRSQRHMVTPCNDGSPGRVGRGCVWA